MNLRALVIVLVLGIAALGYFAWRRNTEPAAPAASGTGAGAADAPAPPGGMPSMPPDAMQAPPARDPGFQWKKPGRWIEQLVEGMRLATYVVPASKPGAEDATCAVYHFGPGQGGGVEANLERWIGEFSAAAKPSRRLETVNGMQVARVEMSGVYAAHGGTDGGGEKSDWALLGAIVEGPNGELFFKLTGPASTVAASTKEFDALLRSLARK